MQLKAGEAPEVPGEGGEQHAHHVDAESEVEDQPAAEAVGEPAEQQGPHHRAADVAGRDIADVLVGQAEGLLVPEDRADRTDNGDLQSVEDPGDPSATTTSRWKLLQGRRSMRAGMSVVISLNVVAAALIPGSFSSLRDSAGGRRGFR